jgi:hypothetical protein
MITPNIALDSISKGARHRLAVIGVPKYIINPMVDDVLKWVKSSGVEWTVRRLKDLKLTFILRNAGSPKYTAPWVRKNSRGDYYGWIGSLTRWCKDKGNWRKSLKRFARVIQALNIYTLFRADQATKLQLDKFLAGVNCTEPSGLDYRKFYVPFLKHVQRTIGKRDIVRGGNSVIEWNGSPSKMAPRPHGQKKVAQDSELFGEIRWFESKAAYTFGWEYNALYGPVFSPIDGPLERYRPVPSLDEDLYGGEVHFLQEPGMKLRAIASPYRIHQMALKPLGDAIYRIVQKLDWDCTFDQSKALPSIQAALREGRMVYSVDLTGATDYFPLEIQLMVLREIFGDVQDIDLLTDICKMRWKSQIGDIQWKRGQPLGLFPSFGMFTLTHGLVLSFLAKGDNSKFYVVGDDVVILDDELYTEYIEFLDVTKCPYSKDKTLSSNLLAEFTGKLITPYQVIPQYKWREMSKDNFLDICAQLGPRSRELLTPRQKKVFDAVKHLVPPLGLNFSAPGSNLLQMIINTEKVLSRISESGVRSLVDLTQQINRKSYKSVVPYQLNSERVQKIQQTFDVKVLSVYTQTVFLRARALWDMVSDIPRALDLKPRLPTEVHTPSRVSTLFRYEGLLRRAKLLN